MPPLSVYSVDVLREAQEKKRANAKALQVAEAEAAERALEAQYGGKEGLKRKREEDALEAIRKKEADEARARRFRTINEMAGIMIDSFKQVGRCSGANLPDVTANMPKPQAKDTFYLTDTGDRVTFLNAPGFVRDFFSYSLTNRLTFSS